MMAEAGMAAVVEQMVFCSGVPGGSRLGWRERTTTSGLSPSKEGGGVAVANGVPVSLELIPPESGFTTMSPGPRVL